MEPMPQLTIPQSWSGYGPSHGTLDEPPNCIDLESPSQHVDAAVPHASRNEDPPLAQADPDFGDDDDVSQLEKYLSSLTKDQKENVVASALGALSKKYNREYTALMAAVATGSVDPRSSLGQKFARACENDPDLEAKYPACGAAAQRGGGSSCQGQVSP